MKEETKLLYNQFMLFVKEGVHDVRSRNHFSWAKNDYTGLNSRNKYMQKLKRLVKIGKLEEGKTPQGQAYLNDKGNPRLEMPPIYTYFTKWGYYADLAHELMHYYRQANNLDFEEKLFYLLFYKDRDLYDLEEIIAEFGAMLLLKKAKIKFDKELNFFYIEEYLKQFPSIWPKSWLMYFLVWHAERTCKEIHKCYLTNKRF